MPDNLRIAEIPCSSCRCIRARRNARNRKAPKHRHHRRGIGRPTKTRSAAALALSGLADLPALPARSSAAAHHRAARCWTFAARRQGHVPYLAAIAPKVLPHGPVCRCSTPSGAGKRICSKARARCFTSTTALILRHLVQHGGGDGGDRLSPGPTPSTTCSASARPTPRGRAGPFLTEQQNGFGGRSARRGPEFGTVTGRARCGKVRRCAGAPDVRTCGIDGCAAPSSTSSSTVSWRNQGPPASSDGREIDYLPAGERAARVEPLRDDRRLERTLARPILAQLRRRR